MFFFFIFLQIAYWELKTKSYCLSTKHAKIHVAIVCGSSDKAKIINVFLVFFVILFLETRERQAR